MMMHNLAVTKLQRQIGPMFDVCLGMQVIQDINHRLSFHPGAPMSLPRQLGTVAAARKAQHETEVLEEHHLQIQRDNKLLLLVEQCMVLFFHGQSTKKTIFSWESQSLQIDVACVCQRQVAHYVVTKTDSTFKERHHWFLH